MRTYDDMTAVLTVASGVVAIADVVWRALRAKRPADVGHRAAADFHCGAEWTIPVIDVDAEEARARHLRRQVDRVGKGRYLYLIVLPLAVLFLLHVTSLACVTAAEQGGKYLVFAVIIGGVTAIWRVAVWAAAAYMWPMQHALNQWGLALLRWRYLRCVRESRGF